MKAYVIKIAPVIPGLKIKIKSYNQAKLVAPALHYF
ncbi:MAG: hypothetical protein JWR61_4417 [Ferruginibacter sp.]|nr:hypothetical protein [Ferruginibacter sp.]